MTALTLALSLSNSFTKVGAIAAFVALAGIAVLSLLVFSQAREIKRLREWAGRAPERAAEMEQRVSAGASARVQRGSAPATPQSRVVPRTTPLVSAPVATAVGASAAAVAPAAVTPATEARVAETSAPVSDTPVQVEPEEPAQPSTAPAEIPAATPAAAVASAEPKEEKSATTPEPVTAAGQGATPRSPLPPSPAAPAPAAPRSGSIAAARPPSSRVVDSRPRAAAGGGTGAVASGVVSRAATPAGGGRKDFRKERTPTRAIVLGVGVAIMVVLVLIFAVSALKGGSSTPTTAQNTGGSQSAGSTSQTTTRHKTNRSAVAANPAETSVVVLNGTGTTGLARHLASDLQQGGYTQALASAAVPPGTHQITVVEYSSGHRADAQGVARRLNVTQVAPMDSTISGLVGSATVVVLAGADQAAQLGGGGAQSQGEPAAGQ